MVGLYKVYKGQNDVIDGVSRESEIHSCTRERDRSHINPILTTNPLAIYTVPSEPILFPKSHATRHRCDEATLLWFN